MWFELLKSQPTNLTSLAVVLYRDSSTDRLVNTLQNQTVIPALELLLKRYLSGSITIEQIAQSLAIPDFDTKKAKENLDKILEVANLNIVRDEIKELQEVINLYVKIKNPNEETTEADEKELQEKIKRIENLKVSPNKRRNTEFKNLYDFFNRNIRPKENFVLTFRDIPKNSKDFQEKIEKFSKFVVKEEKIGEETVTTYIGKVENSKILTNFESQEEFNNFLEQNSEIYDYFSKNLLDFSPNWVKTRTTSGKKRKRERIESKFDEYIETNKTFNTKKIENFSDIEAYFKAIEKIPFVIKEFIPKSLSKGKIEEVFIEEGKEITQTFDETYDFPPSLILSRQSSNALNNAGVKSIVMNPYGELLLANEYLDKNTWFSEFFDDVRVSQIMSENLAQLMLLDDIYDMIFLNRESKFNINRDLFSDINLSSDREESRNKLKSIIFSDFRLNEMFREKYAPLLQNQLKDLETNFTFKEANEIKELWVDLEDPDVPMEKKKEILDKYGLENNPELEEEYGEITFIYKDADGKETGEEFAKYVEIELDDNFKTPKQIKEMLQKENIRVEMIPLREFVLDSDKSNNRFIGYILSLTNAEIDEIIANSQSRSAKTLDKLEPSNSIAFLLGMSQGMSGKNRTLISDALNDIKSTESISEKTDILEKLNDNMPNFLEDMKKAVFDAFQTVLDYYAKNFLTLGSRTKAKAVKTVDTFLRYGLFTE